MMLILAGRCNSGCASNIVQNKPARRSQNRIVFFGRHISSSFSDG